MITHVTFPAMKTEMLIELYDVARLMRTRFDRWARTYGMTRAQGVILARLSRQPGMAQNEMAGLCEVEPITVGRLVDRLEARGLLERRLDPADRRIRRLHLLHQLGIPGFRAVGVNPVGTGAEGGQVHRLHGQAAALQRLGDSGLVCQPCVAARGAWASSRSGSRSTSLRASSSNCPSLPRPSRTAPSCRASGAS